MQGVQRSQARGASPLSAGNCRGSDPIGGGCRGVARPAPESGGGLSGVSAASFLVVATSEGSDVGEEGAVRVLAAPVGLGGPDRARRPARLRGGIVRGTPLQLSPLVPVRASGRPIVQLDRHAM